MTLHMNDTFESFEQFNEKLKQFQAETFTQFSFRNSEKLPATDSLSKTHIYRVLRYVCKHAKAAHKPTGGQVRRPKRSYKVDCPVQLNVRLNRPKGGVPVLKVTKLMMDHNHLVSNKIFKIYPEQRRFVSDKTDKIPLPSKMMKMSKKKPIMEQPHGVPLLSRDVYNQEKRFGSTKVGIDGDICQTILDDVIKRGGFGMVVREEQSQEFLFCAFQTEVMRKTLHRFPCVLIMDCTYKINQYLYPLLTVMAVDGEGHGMPVFHAILSREDKVLMTRCLTLLSEQFDNRSTRCFIIDMDMAKLDVITSVFPEVPVNLCLFHISQAVEHQIRKSLGRRLAAVKAVLGLFIAQVMTESETEFNELTDDIKTIVPDTVANYFQEQWLSKKQLWAVCCNVNVMKLHATTTNALKSYHAKIKKTLKEKLSLGKTLEQLIQFNDAKITEANRLRLIGAVCKRYDAFHSSPLEMEISASMSRFGGELLKQELNLSQKTDYDISPKSESENIFFVSYRDRCNETSAVSCTCSSFGHMNLPCRHMFVIRRHLQIPPFDSALIPEHFNVSYEHGGGTNHMESVQTMSISAGPSTSFHSMEGRYRAARQISDKIVDFLAICDEWEFEEKLQELKDILGRWSSRGRQAGFVEEVGTVEVEVYLRAEDCMAAGE